MADSRIITTASPSDGSNIIALSVVVRARMTDV
jgi:hypothetical protein